MEDVLHDENIRQTPDVELMPAGLYYPNHGGFGIYIKWRGNGTRDETKILSAGSWHLHMSTPDRELFITGSLHDGKSPNLTFGDWDEFVPISIFYEPTSKGVGQGPTHYMVNAYQFKTNSSRSHRTRENRDVSALHQRSKTIFGDSGGFQLRRKSEFIDPHSVADYYNDNVDYGMVLDIPLLDAYYWDNVEASAHIQKENTEIMLRHLKGPKLINVIHGYKLDFRKKFLEIIHHPEIHSMAVSRASYNDGMIAFAEGVYSFTNHLHEAHPGHYNHLHILGVSDAKTYIPLLRMMAYGLLGPIRMTLDSSTHLQMATSKAYIASRHSLENNVSLAIGNDNNYPSSMQRTPCSCLVCRNVGWMDAFNILPGNSVVAFMLMYHNIHATDAFFRQMLWYCTHSSAEDLATQVKRMFSGNKGVANEIEQCIYFIEEIKNKGIASARKKFNYFLHLSDNDSTPMNTLFGGVVNSDYTEEDYLFDQQSDSDDKPDRIRDAERIELFQQRLAAMREMQSRTADRDRGALKHKKIGKKVRTLKVKSIAEDGTEVVKQIKTKGRSKKPIRVLVADDDKKVVVATKARSGPSLTKYKQSKKTKPKKDKDTKKVLGKVIQKSKNRKRL